MDDAIQFPGLVSITEFGICILDDNEESVLFDFANIGTITSFHKPSNSLFHLRL